MATRKQRRRREKGRRHEYEYVYVDDSGDEVEVEKPEPKPRAEKKAAAAKSGGKPGARGGRTIEPPSWERTFRRAAIFVPIMLVVLYIARPKSASTLAVVLQAVFLCAVLILFMYAMDSFLYRSYQKRQGKRSGSPPKTK